MGKLRKQNSNLPAFPRITPDKAETFAGKWTARVTKIFNQPDGSIIKATRKINKDGSITDKIEHTHKYHICASSWSLAVPNNKK